MSATPASTHSALRVVAALTLGTGALAGCGPFSYLGNVPLGAAAVLKEARQDDAARLAPYEVTAAEEYLAKARELAGYSRWHSANTFGRKALESARKAHEIALDKKAHPGRDAAPPVGEVAGPRPALPAAPTVKIIEPPAAPTSAPPPPAPAAPAAKPAGATPSPTSPTAPTPSAAPTPPPAAPAPPPAAATPPPAAPATLPAAPPPAPGGAR